MDRMPLNLPKPGILAHESQYLQKPPAACPTHEPVTREEGQRHGFFNDLGEAAMTFTARADQPEYATPDAIAQYEAALDALAEMVSQARESYFRNAPPAERAEYEENLRNTRGLMNAAGDHPDDAEDESIALLNGARESYFRNAPQSERDEHEQSMQRIRSMNNAEIVAYCNERKQEHLQNG
jgi:hypothetical protein